MPQINMWCSVVYCMLIILSSQVVTTTTLADLKKFTTGERISAVAFIPIATRLLSKVEEPGIGKGFVSSTKTPKELADKLFEAFFSTKARVVALKDEDMSGISALQSLPINEPTTGLPSSVQKSWHSVNKRRNGLKRGGNKNESKEQKACRWKYECVDPEDPDSCKLLLCKDSDLENEEAKSQRRTSAQMNRDNQIRKWLGITEIDEEVEKILETRHAADHTDYVVDEKLKKLTDRFEHIMDRYSATSTDSIGLQ
ncbi:uncharacterized protein LOC121727739 [Aricia agestis]|uniref:uncharacterized protein LOC121727739 n=1 Tax=Aricia agestis TaxID=91739 RepID=UPI001C2098A5|nr:uncharacterized protein LOC121727739 [Aricia agestis]